MKLNRMFYHSGIILNLTKIALIITTITLLSVNEEI